MLVAKSFKLVTTGLLWRIAQAGRAIGYARLLPFARRLRAALDNVLFSAWATPFYALGWLAGAIVKAARIMLASLAEGYESGKQL